ncbi:MAG: molybdate ABC transporter substrate-binding protein [Actinobacteria bacterium]|nr:molybdate ABC transporter substrate-binding protein [Actinomycetota bacterium]
MRLVALLAGLVVLAGCGGNEDEPLTVYAASSLTAVFEQLAPAARFNFAGSDELATQLREGAQADVYAAASPRYPGELFEEGIVDEPTMFATNRLVIVVPSGNPAGIGELDDLAGADVRLVIGGEGVPIGDYTRELLERAGRLDVLERVVSEEEDVKGVLAKVAAGEADAGFVYATDVRAAGGDVVGIELPSELHGRIEYPVAVVRDTERGEEAQRFVELLRSPRGQSALRAAGFGLP